MQAGQAENAGAQFGDFSAAVQMTVVEPGFEAGAFVPAHQVVSGQRPLSSGAGRSSSVRPTPMRARPSARSTSRFRWRMNAMSRCCWSTQTSQSPKFSRRWASAADRGSSMRSSIGRTPKSNILSVRQCPICSYCPQGIRRIATPNCSPRPGAGRGGPTDCPQPRAHRHLRLRTRTRCIACGGTRAAYGDAFSGPDGGTRRQDRRA